MIRISIIIDRLFTFTCAALIEQVTLWDTIIEGVSAIRAQVQILHFLFYGIILY